MGQIYDEFVACIDRFYLTVNIRYTANRALGNQRIIDSVNYDWNADGKADNNNSGDCSVDFLTGTGLHNSKTFTFPEKSISVEKWMRETIERICRIKGKKL